MLSKTHINKMSGLFLVLFEILVLCFSGASSFCSSRIVVESKCKVIANESKENDEHLSYCGTYYDNNSYETVLKAFNNLQNENFSGSTQILPTCLSEDDCLPKRFLSRIDCGAGEESEVVVGNGFYYSYNTNLCRLETLCINVYQKDWTNPYELDGEHGFVYLPDFLADYLIERNDDFNAYDDLLPKFSDTRQMVDKKILKINSDIGERKWVIAGIYHSNGFNESFLKDAEFSYNDLNFGKAFNNFGYPMLIAYDSAFSRKHLNGLLTLSQPKTYLIDQNITKLKVFANESESVTRYYKVRNGLVEKMSEGSFEPSNWTVPSWAFFLFFSLSIVCLICFLWLLKKNLREKPKKEFLLLIFVPLFTSGLVSTIFKTFLGSICIGFNIFFSIYFGLSFIALFLASLCCIFFEKQECLKV